jgi:hypothetical protein
MKKNVTVLKPVTLEFYAEYADTRTGQLFTFQMSRLVRAVDGTDAIPVLTIDSPSTLDWNPVRDITAQTITAKLMVGDTDVTATGKCKFFWYRLLSTGALEAITTGAGDNDWEFVSLNKNVYKIDRNYIGDDITIVCKATYAASGTPASTTDSLNYDRLYNLGYYFEGGTLTDEENILTSDWGEYSPATKIAVFNHEVKLANPRFTLYSDTLKYSTDSKIATILGPSNIVNEKNHIYSERGFYNTAKDQAQLLDRSVLTNEGKKLVADSLFYDRKTGYGEAFYNVVMNDTINKNMLTGDYCFYNELTESALATQKAVAIDYSQGDSLFMHAELFSSTKVLSNFR